MTPETINTETLLALYENVDIYGKPLKNPAAYYAAPREEDFGNSGPATGEQMNRELEKLWELIQS